MRRRAFASATNGGGRADGLRVYAGLRSDPFFSDKTGYLESIKTGRLAFKHPGQNGVAGLNILSVIIEADCKPLLQSSQPRFPDVVKARVSPVTYRYSRLCCCGVPPQMIPAGRGRVSVT